ncbi:PadR family transcriptional regulator [Pengzhenrongella sp.]|jgi:DNA-binding PadR family transcriptional regulator|uniref:PadR family transcriptional regulator n=1 Tax=Pengzhenrongella sp. TaxID=2888820 RepID=UPI002F9525D1
MSNPLQEPSFLILTALASGPQHGYGVIKDVDAISGGRVTMRVGTLYGALDRLAATGLVEVDREEIVSSRLRRYYRLTDSGRERLRVEAERTRDQAQAALFRLGAAGALA